MALGVSGIVMLLLGCITSFTAFGDDMTTYFGATTVSLIELMCYASGVLLAILAVLITVTPMIRTPRQLARMSQVPE
jgi:hypothetical protein